MSDRGGGLVRMRVLQMMSLLGGGLAVAVLFALLLGTDSRHNSVDVEELPPSRP